MGLVSVTLPQDGTTADVSDYNTPLTTIVNALNGNLDTNNVSSVSGTKLTAATTPASAFDNNTRGGWQSGILPLVSSISYNGNHSYTVGFASSVASYLTPGMRLRLSRQTAAPTQCTSLNGTTQYYSKTSPAAMTFTDDFTVSAWVKLTSYPAVAGTIASRWDGTNGWGLYITATGQVQMYGSNAAAVNFSNVQSYQSIPLNKWVHIAAQLDMSTFTATTATSYVMIDGIDAPSTVAHGGTNPTALIQAGNLQIGARNSTDFFPGKLAQVAIFNAKVTQATMITYISQGLVGVETSLISAYSFNNSINDLSSNANNLTANASAVATNADSPFALDANAVPGGTYEFGIVQKVATSTVTVQVPEGCAIPTTGGVSAVDYSSWKVPYGFPADSNKWRIIFLLLTTVLAGSAAVSYTNYASAVLNVPIGSYRLGFIGSFYATRGASSIGQNCVFLSTSASSISGLVSRNLTMPVYISATGATGAEIFAPVTAFDGITLAVATPIYALNYSETGLANGGWHASNLPSPGPARALEIYAENAYL